MSQVSSEIAQCRMKQKEMASDIADVKNMLEKLIR
jgi:hypothetical protein